MEDQRSLAQLELTVVPEKLSLFTTVFQYGIEITTSGDTTLGGLLSAFPGFTAEYLATTVQTIFQNGTAVDDLTTRLEGEQPVVALSAAMPGLAGAIFRKNSFHAALRTDTHHQKPRSAQDKTITVTLKLFNKIALDQGAKLLRSGVCLKARTLAAFFSKRPELVQGIVQARLGENTIDVASMHQILATPAKVRLKILTSSLP
jgi:hypothetical protein